MVKTNHALTTIEAIDRQREANEQKLKEFKAVLDNLDKKKQSVDVELNKLKKKKLWGLLSSSFR